MIAESYRREIQYCTFCPKMCRFVCPTAIAEARETVTPTGKQTLLYLVQQEAVPLDTEAVQTFQQCTGCGLCTEYCDHDIDVYPVMREARAEGARRGVVTPEARNVLDNYLQYGNPYGNLTPAYLNRVGARILRQAQVFYVPDVSAIARRPEALDAVLLVLEKLHQENVALWPGPMLGSGYLLHTLGFDDEFRAHAKAFADVARGARTLVFASPHDAETVRKHYPAAGAQLEAEVLTEAEWLLRILAHQDVPGQSARRVLYHDPCSLGRGLGVYDAPRRIIEAVNGSPALEFSWSGAESKCCGWGGGYAFTVPESAKIVARNRIDEAVEQTPDEIVTGSTSCAVQLLSAAGHSMPVFDLMTWLAVRL